MCSPKKVSFALYIRTKRFAPNVWCANVWHDASSHAMSSFWDDSDSDSSSGDDGPTLRQRRDKWRRLADNIRAEADRMAKRMRGAGWSKNAQEASARGSWD